MINIDTNKFNFPTGEMHIKLLEHGTGLIEFVFEKNEDIIELLLTVNVMKQKGITRKTLVIPYVPFSRQDRVTSDNEPFSLLVFAELINGLGFERVVVSDPHSDVTPALIKNCVVIPQEDIWAPYFEKHIGRDDRFFLISPDGGALKKIYKLSTKVNPTGVVECSKIRDTKTGDITATVVHCGDLRGSICYIVDDICDGGLTFIEIAKILKTKNCGKIVLMVTHGFFTKGFDVFDGLIDEIYTRKGRVK